METKLILFDMGETLLDFGPIDVDHAFREGARDSYRFLQQCAGGGHRLVSFGRYKLGNWLSVRIHYLKSMVTLKEFRFMDLMAERVKKMGIELTESQKAELTAVWFKNTERLARIEEGLVETLTELRDMAIELAIVSNTFLPGLIHDRHLADFGLLELFKLRLYSSETVWRKPHARIYQLAMEELGYRPEQTVMVGDRLREDVRGPQRLGIRGIYKRGVVNRHKRVPKDVTVIDRIAELPGLIRRWNGEK